MEIPQADLLGTMFSALIYGIYFSLFIQHIQMLHRRKSKAWSFLYIYGTTILLFVLITANLAISMTFTMKGYMAGMSSPNGSLTFFKTTLLSERLGILLYDAVTLVCAFFLVFRCFILWDHNYAIASVPIIMFLINVGLFFANIFVGTANLIGPFVALTLAQNLLSTCMIIWKILSLQKAVATNLNLTRTINTRRPLSSRVVFVLIESAAIYFIGEAAIIATLYLHSPLFRTFSSCITPVLGLNFSAIVLRNGTHKRSTETLSNPSFSESPLDLNEESSTVGYTDVVRNPDSRAHCGVSNDAFSGVGAFPDRVDRINEIEKAPVMHIT